MFLRGFYESFIDQKKESKICGHGLEPENVDVLKEWAGKLSAQILKAPKIERSFQELEKSHSRYALESYNSIYTAWTLVQPH